MTAHDRSTEETLASLNEAGRRFVESIMAAWPEQSRVDSTAIATALSTALTQDRTRWETMQQQYYARHLELWQKLSQGETAAPAKDGETDRRFSAPEWRDLPYFDYLRQAYQLNASWLKDMAAALPLEDRLKKRLDFFTRQMIDAAAPANFAATNPEVLKLAATTKGESLRRGLELLREDVAKNRITMSDEAAFEIGRNIAMTPGDVVFENELMQLIQYRPATATVNALPLVMVPPCINKYYILDLQPDNSFARFAVDSGHTVFMVSWRNMPPDQGHITWDQYIELGVIKALDVARAICGVDQVNTLGFCVGGTLLAAALAVQHGRGERPAASMTLLTTMLDFSDTGELSVFVDEDYVRQRERAYAEGGVMRGQELALTFASLRANDLIWNYVVNSYLKGRKPDAFDLLYWNSDSTNLPGAMYAYYVRNTYLENNLRVPGRLTMCGVPVDLGSVDVPAYLMASREDHIVPWRTAWQNTQLLGGEHTFVLAASGHIAGVINPASKNKRHFWTGAAAAAADGWLDGAERRPGSWWTHWMDWLDARCDISVTAPAAAGNAEYPVIEPAPGRYVRQRCDDPNM
jgi:polyhydroxyalkanoate synthase